MYLRWICSNRGIFVSEDAAFDFAKANMDKLSEEDRKEFVKWFFSDNWIEEEGELPWEHQYSTH